MLNWWNCKSFFSYISLLPSWEKNTGSKQNIWQQQIIIEKYEIVIYTMADRTNIGSIYRQKQMTLGCWSLTFCGILWEGLSQYNKLEAFSTLSPLWHLVWSYRTLQWSQLPAAILGPVLSDFTSMTFQVDYKQPGFLFSKCLACFYWHLH